MSSWEKKRRVMRRYDVTANIYDVRYAEEQTAKIEAALADVKLGKQSTVLDAGCGTGLLFGHVADRVKTVVGLDISRKTLHQAKKREKVLPNVHLILADADHTPFKDQTFSHVFAMTLIQNAPDPVATLREVRRVASKCAQIVVTGLKRVFLLKDFLGVIQSSCLKMTSLHDEGLQCYLAVCVSEAP